MLSKNEVKYIQSLCHKANRDEAGLFVAEGPKLAAELLHSTVTIRMVYATSEWINQQSSAQFPVTEISRQELERISQLQTPHQVVVVAQQQRPNEEPSLQNQLTLVLDGIQDPGNMGTILRTADWFGIQQVVCSADCADQYNSKVVQATMGSIARVRCWVKDLAEWLPQTGVPVFGAMLQGNDIHTIPAVQEALLVIGSEGRGITSGLLPYITNAVTIPRIGDAESLNAAVATGILLSTLTSSAK